MIDDPNALADRRARQKRIATILSIVVIILGFVLLFALPRVPLPMRILAGLGDIFVGCVLLVLIRQQK